MSTPPPSRPLVARLFVSTEAPPRLRTGWRLALHSVVTLALILLAAVPVGMALFVWMSLTGEGPAIDSPPLLLGFSLSSLVAITLSTFAARRLLDRRSFRSLGLRPDRRALTDLALGFAITAVQFALIYAVMSVAGWIRFEGFAWERAGWAPALAGLALGWALHASVGFQEEVLSRGYHMQNLAGALGLPWAIVLSSAVFSLLHLANPGAGLPSVLGIFGAGLFLAYGWVRTRQLWLPIGLHAGWNFFQGPVFGFPVSGMAMERLVHHTVEGPAAITGGAFGPEAGLIVVPTLLFGAALVAWATRGRLSEPSES